MYTNIQNRHSQLLLKGKPIKSKIYIHAKNNLIRLCTVGNQGQDLQLLHNVMLIDIILTINLACEIHSPIIFWAQWYSTSCQHG